MTMLEKSSNGSETVVEEFENNDATVEDNGMSEIVDHVNLRVIQEEIDEALTNINEAETKGFGYAVIAFLSGLGMVAAGVVAGIVGSADVGLLTLGSFFFVPMGGLITILSPMLVSDFTHNKIRNLRSLRKKLLQQSLTDEIVSGADNLNEDWSEVSAINGDDAVKHLVRIVKDKNTGFENIETKQFKS